MIATCSAEVDPRLLLIAELQQAHALVEAEAGVLEARRRGAGR